MQVADAEHLAFKIEMAKITEIENIFHVFLYL